MRLPGAYRSLPRPSSALKPSHPSHSVVTSKNFAIPTAGVGAYTWPHHRLQMSNLKRLCPSPPTFPLGVARFFDIDILGRALLFLAQSVFVLGGDPAAGSPTATLLRLNPPYEAQVRNGQHSTIPHPNLIRVVRRAVCARSRDVFTAG
jgi:hypothetical protein